MGRARKSLVQKLLRAADNPYFELPGSWHVLTRYRTAEMFLKHPSPPSVRYSDAPLYAQLRKEFPQVKLQPMRLNASTASQPSLATRFVQQQLVAMRTEYASQQEQQRRLRQQQQDLAQRGLPQSMEQPQQQSAEELRQATYAAVKAQMLKELQDAGAETSTGGFLEYIQEQEEAALQAALRRLKEQQTMAQQE